MKSGIRSIGPGPVQRHQRDDVLEAVDRRLLEQVAHAARFELEHGGGVACREDVVGRLVVERQRLQVDRRRRVQHAHVADRPVEDGERGQAEEVELHQADRLDVVLVELRDDGVGVGLHVQRAEVGELARRDQHAARVHADVARQALELLGEREQLAALPPRRPRARRAAAPSRARRPRWTPARPSAA